MTTVANSNPQTKIVRSRESDRPRVGYDARFSIGEYRGMGRYLRRLVRPIEACCIGFCASGETDPSLSLRARGHRFYPMWEQLSLPRHASELDLEFFLAPYNTAPLRLPRRTRLILVVHDLIYLRPQSELPLSPSSYQNFGRIYRRCIVPRAVRLADQIICVSEFTREELVRRLHVDPRKVLVIPNSVDADWYALPRPIEPEDYILCVSGEAPNKNLEVALQGFAEYRRNCGDRSTVLRILGVKPAHWGPFQDIAHQLGVGSSVEFLDYVPHATLQSLYANAACLFFPSREEGFGIPVLEALAAGLPVVTASASSMPEVAGDAALYFHPDSPSEMGKQLSAVLSNPHLQSIMSIRGRERARRFHPDVVDACIHDFWNRTLGGR